jgi:hypothetical protein
MDRRHERYGAQTRVRPAVAALSTSLTCLALAAGTAAAGPILKKDKLSSKAHSNQSRGFAGLVTTSKPLGDGLLYLARAKGTYSAFREGLMDGTPGWHMCGTAGFSGLGLTGQDAENIFAIPKPNGILCPSLPRHHANFEISEDDGGTWGHLEPGQVGLHPHHRYTYVLHGQGEAAGFRIKDSNTTDNYGALKIRVRQAKSSDCATYYEQLGFADKPSCRASVPNAP